MTLFLLSMKLSTNSESNLIKKTLFFLPNKSNFLSQLQFYEKNTNFKKDLNNFKQFAGTY